MPTLSTIAIISFAHRQIATIDDSNLPCDLTKDVYWGNEDRFLAIQNQYGGFIKYDFGVIPLTEASCASISIRISSIGALQADCLLGKGTVPSPIDFLAGKASGLRLQPFVLPGFSKVMHQEKGQGLITRGLHYSGIITRSKVSLICLCDECQKTFRLQPFHSGFSHLEYYYCDSGLHTLVVDSSSISTVLGGDIAVNSLQLEIEKHLPPCSQCNGMFRYLNPLRCPYCLNPYIDFQKFPEIRKQEYYGNTFFGNSVQHSNLEGLIQR